MTGQAFFVLTALADGPRHGYGIVGEVEELSQGRVKLKIGPGWDLLPVEAVRNAVPGLLVQVDANGSYHEGDADHLERLRLIAAGLGIADAELDDALARLTDDPETYFLSAEGHNRWRGGVPYDRFPMRRCVSIQLCVPVP